MLLSEVKQFLYMIFTKVNLRDHNTESTNLSCQQTYITPLVAISMSHIFHVVQRWKQLIQCYQCFALGRLCHRVQKIWQSLMRHDGPMANAHCGGATSMSKDVWIWEDWRVNKINDTDEIGCCKLLTGIHTDRD
jgi:hypothetical protein